MDFSNLKITVIGDLILDRFLFSDRVFVPGEKCSLDCRRSISTLGGAGNVVKMLASLGCSVDFVTRANVHNRSRLSSLFAQFPKITCHIVYDNEPQNEVMQFLLNDEPQYTLRYLLPSTPQPRLLEYLSSIQFESDVCILSDYGTGWITREMVEVVLGKWHTTIVDPKDSFSLDKWGGCSIIKPNYLEGGNLSRYSSQTLCVTQGSDGLTYMSGPVKIHIPPAVITEYKDSIGAGDAVVSGLACSLASKKTFLEACRIGNIFGGAACCCSGTYETLTPSLISEISRLNNVEF